MVPIVKINLIVVLSQVKLFAIYIPGIFFNFDFFSIIFVPEENLFSAGESSEAENSDESASESLKLSDIQGEEPIAHKRSESRLEYFLVEDLLAWNIIGQNWENYWSKTIDQKDSQNSRYLSKVKHISRNILVEFACTLHPNTFPEKANPFFLMIF